MAEIAISRVTRETFWFIDKCPMVSLIVYNYSLIGPPTFLPQENFT